MLEQAVHCVLFITVAELGLLILGLGILGLLKICTLIADMIRDLPSK